MSAPLTFHQCCQMVANHCSNGYAISYANAGLRLTEPRAQRAQALYILNNLKGWTGEYAQRVRARLKEIAR